jgi:hypothetical protein
VKTFRGQISSFQCDSSLQLVESAKIGYLRRYAAEMSWREDMRATDNSRLTSEGVALPLGRGHSVDWRGYWRRWQHAA